jgi:hypothetical protein
MFGQPVGGFPAAEYGTGIHELDWIPSANKLAPGMYVIQLATNNYRLTQKLIKN